MTNAAEALSLLWGIGADGLQVVMRLFGMPFLDVVYGGYGPHYARKAEDAEKLKFGAVGDVLVKWVCHWPGGRQSAMAS
jgi:hypothetical protein